METCHAYGKCYKQCTNTSLRTRLAMQRFDKLTNEDNIKKKKKWSKKTKFTFRKRKKEFVENKLNPFKKLKKITANQSFAIKTSILKQKKHFFYYDPQQKLLESYFNKTNGKKVIIDANRLQLLDEINGCYGASSNGIPPFILIPRSQSLNSGPIEIKHQEKALYKLVRGITLTKRGKSKDAVYSHYATLGAHARRGSHGISYKVIKAKLKRDFNVVIKMVKKGEHCANNVLPHSVISALKRTQTLFQWSCLQSAEPKEGNKEESALWASVATSYNYASAAHVDTDFFLSMLTVTSSEYTVNNQYTMEQPIALYFLFPELGLGIGLRPGDQLIFNPLYYHCISTKNFDAYKKNVHVTSFYLKTAIVGENNNKKELETKLFG